MPTYQYVFSMHGVSKTYPGGHQVLKDVSLSFLPNTRIGVVGNNGSGKSTLLRIMSGLDNEFNGTISAAPGIRTGYLAQEPSLNTNKNVWENVLDGVKAKKELVDRYTEIAMNYSDDTAEEMARLQDEIDAKDLWNLDQKVEMAMDALRCPNKDSDVMCLSGGEKRRVALCKVLLEEPELLLLDEPTNHLDAQSVSWLEHYLKGYKGSVILITHDRYFLDNITGWILEIDNGRGIPYQGNYSAWLEQKKKRLEVDGNREVALQKTLEQELEWIRSSPKARQSKNKARIQAYEDLYASANQQERIKTRIVIPSGPRLGGVVVEACHLCKGYGDRLLIDDLSFRLPPGGIVGIIGPNGVGKTTLFRMIAGLEAPDFGSVKVGTTVEIGHVDQSRDSLAPQKTIWEEISGGLDVLELGNKLTIQSRAYVGAFGFKGSQQQKKVGILSGGERNRVHIAKVLTSGSNLLLLDEPTNDLDMETLQALEEALLNFAGCAMITSHDRWFLDKVATHMLAFEGDSHVEWFEGNYRDYDEDRRRRLGPESDVPRNIAYKKFVR